MRQNTALQKLAQLALYKPGNNAFALTLPGQEGLEMFGYYIIENSVCWIARNIILGGIAYGKFITQPHAAFIFILQLTLRKIESILAYHWHYGLPRLWKTAIDLIAPFQVEPTFFMPD